MMKSTNLISKTSIYKIFVSNLFHVILNHVQIYIYTEKVINYGKTYFLSSNSYLVGLKNLIFTDILHGHPFPFYFTIARVKTRNSYIKNFDGRSFQ